jgi:hypothetical protein
MEVSAFVQPAMRPFLLAISAIRVASQVFESENFNVTEALIAQGVDVSALPQLNGLTERSSDVACSIAVSTYLPSTSCVLKTKISQCSSLSVIYGNNAVDFKDEVAYSNFTGKFWSGISAGVRPYCIFKPSNPSAVSVMVLLSRLSQCPFAVKSGGHSAFAGAATIEGGITVSFENLKGIELSSDKKTVAVQPGRNWGGVLTALSSTGVTVTTGRIGDIGVGGLTLGGGISFLSNEYGLACDNVASFEVSNMTVHLVGFS